MRTVLGTCVAACVVLGVSGGDLDPSGAPAPTMTDLQSIAEDAAAARSNASSAANEARAAQDVRIAVNEENTPGDGRAFYIIDRSGSFYLTGNVSNRSLQSAKHGILIEASDVTLDLGGFTLDGYEPFIIPLGEAPEPQIIVQPTAGILALEELVNITVRNGTVRDWTGMGVRLFVAGNTLVEGIMAADNGDEGIWAGDGGVVTRCVVRGNLGTGIIADDGSTISHCAASDNGENGIYANPGGMVIGCTAEGNGGNGIGLGSGSSAVDCNSSRNAAAGIRAASGSVLRSCTARSNGTNGIETDGRGALIVGNSCLWNGNGDDAQIFVGGSVATDNRVEGNQAISLGSDAGIRVTSAGNLIIGNSATNYAINSGNTVGPILGSADPITSTNPWANFDL